MTRAAFAERLAAPPAGDAESAPLARSRLSEDVGRRQREPGGRCGALPLPLRVLVIFAWLAGFASRAHSREGASARLRCGAWRAAMDECSYRGD